MRFKQYDIVKHFKYETLTDEQKKTEYLSVPDSSVSG